MFSLGEASTPGGDFGLSPTVAYRILKLFGGAVSVEDRHPSGIEMTVSLRCTESLSAINPEVEAAQPGSVLFLRC